MQITTMVVGCWWLTNGREAAEHGKGEVDAPFAVAMSCHHNQFISTAKQKILLALTAAYWIRRGKRTIKKKKKKKKKNEQA